MLFMKKISWIASLLMLVALSGCFDTLDELTIAENGSGTFVNSLDMGKMLGLAKTMGGGNDEMKDLEKLKVDTIVNLKDIKDSLNNLNDAEKKIAATGTLRIQVDAKEDKLNFTFAFPFSNIAEIAPIQSILKKAKDDVIENTMTKLMGEEGDKKNDGFLGGDEEDSDQKEGMGANLDQYYTT